MSALAARLGDTLLARGWLDADQLDIAQAEVRAGRPLEQALAQLGFVPDGVLRDTLAELLGLDSLEARALVADSTALAVVPAHWARQLRVLPLRYAPANQTLTIASASACFFFDQLAGTGMVMCMLHWYGPAIGARPRSACDAKSFTVLS